MKKQDLEKRTKEFSLAVIKFVASLPNTRVADVLGRQLLSPFKKDKIDSILADFEATNLYKNNFLRDLREGLKKSSPYR